MFELFKKKKRIVVVGGGTGTHTVLTGLKRYTNLFELTAIIAMTDSGGSTGKLRDEFGYLPVGDVRMALAALANEENEDVALIRKLFLHRFCTDGDVKGHNFGNLFLMALTDILGSEEAAIRRASRVLRISGTVIPVTTEHTDLLARYADGRCVIGEHHIDEPDRDIAESPIVSLEMRPRAYINEYARNALISADAIVFGPGDLYTSVLANCVANGFKETMKHAQGTVIYISNLMTKFGQTTGMGVREHVDEIESYIGKSVGAVLVNTTPLPENLLMKYEADGEFPVALNMDDEGSKLVKADLLTQEEVTRHKGDTLKRSLIRHDPEKIALKIREVLI